MDVKIYIHGRPQGGDVWSKDTIDSIDASYYIPPFLDYDIGRDVDALMIADRRRGSSYYTYFRHKGLMENNPRRGANAYFAITVKAAGAYCQKVSKLYNLLNQVYEEKVFGKGKIIEPYGDSGFQRFTTGSFKEKETELSEIAEIIKANLEKVIAPYIAPLSKLTDTESSVPVQYSLEEVDSPMFEKDSEQHRVIVSAQYQSFKQKVALLNKEKNNLSQQVTQASQALATREEELKNLQAEKRNAKKDAKSREEREAARKADAEYQDFCQERKEFQEYQREKEAYKGYKSQKDSFSVFQQHKDTLFEFSRRMAGTFSFAEKGGGKADKEGNKKGLSKIWLVWAIGVTIFIVLSVVINAVVLCKVCDNGNRANNPVETTGQTVGQGEKSATEETPITGSNTLAENQDNPDVTTLPTCTIDIEGFSQKKNNLYLQQRFPLKAIGYNGNVRWSCSGKGEIRNGNVLVPIAEGQITIYGEADGATIQERTVVAVKKKQQVTQTTQKTDSIKK